MISFYTFTIKIYTIYIIYLYSAYSVRAACRLYAHCSNIFPQIYINAGHYSTVSMIRMMQLSLRADIFLQLCFPEGGNEVIKEVLLMSMLTPIYGYHHILCSHSISNGVQQNCTCSISNGALCMLQRKGQDLPLNNL